MMVTVYDERLNAQQGNCPALQIEDNTDRSNDRFADCPGRSLTLGPASETLTINRADCVESRLSGFRRSV